MKAIDLAIVKTLLNRSIPSVVDGKDGVDGQTGPQGATGEVGQVGKQGLSGKDGRDAVDGLNGADGHDGSNGAVGKSGKSGAVGKAGLDGRDGVDGKVGPQGEAGTKGDKGDTGKGVASIKVNSEDMLVITFDDGTMTIAGKMHFTREVAGGGGYYTGAPVGSFGITGTKTNDAGELVIVGAWGKEFNTGFSNYSPQQFLNPTFSYVNKILVDIAYSNGPTKDLSYNLNGSLNTLVTTVNGVATTKTFNYNEDGTLASIT